ncbi:SPOR domain-containing protein [Sunxiuqinia elliptica]|uniref:Sporulation related protein n=1 Tax=Sunxiuqinia elliptica TaxID=655355 RepID=A0A4R6GZW0_9BACT|nr:SPOR domain-containing protein [Sunxiuqinia elliptica]TDO01232.1 sporulation related protein [Sunxiuqinia elliptica]TDO57743.1 sporulation related protein [Sunxiuqinia elliptica]
MKSKYLLILFVVALAACKSKESKEELQVEVAPQDTVQQVVMPEPKPEEPTVEIDMGVNLDDKFFLVVDSYTVKEFAESWNKKYQKMGYNSAVIMRNEDGYYRVAVQSFNDFEMAKNALDVLRQEADFSNAWVMVIDK